MAAEVPVLRLPQPHQRHMRPLFFSGACAKLMIRMKMQSVWRYNPGSFKVDDETTNIPLRSWKVHFFGVRVPSSLEAEGAMLITRSWQCCHGSRGGSDGSGSFVLCAELRSITSSGLAPITSRCCSRLDIYVYTYIYIYLFLSDLKVYR